MLNPRTCAGEVKSPTFIFTRFIVSKLVLLCEDALVRYLGFLISTATGFPNYNEVIGLFTANFTPA
jgi:hypothetical protein